jgi:hypothetical protein
VPLGRKAAQPAVDSEIIWVLIRTFFLLARLGDFILLFPFDGTRPVAANNMLITMLSKVIDGSNGGRYFIAVKLLFGPVSELPGRASVVATSPWLARGKQDRECYVSSWRGVN